MRSAPEEKAFRAPVRITARVSWSLWKARAASVSSSVRWRSKALRRSPRSKRTMAICNVIYGITMQESGVSKKISVKFEEYEQQVA